MTIGELARRSGLAASRIRFYEKIGLLKAVDRRPNGYRTYPPEAVVALTLIATAQRSGFTLDEIRALLPDDLIQWEHAPLLAALRRKVAEIEAMEARLAENKALLLALVADIETKPEGIECADNARRVLSRMLDGTIGEQAIDAEDVQTLGKGAAKPAAWSRRRSEQ